ncbi:MAG TPA: hypothetical protein DCY48_04270 [Candidatus Magasanikbacteria bacterium]|nr:MAG: hypothetical protein A3I74_00175 [Candidatus Magasanikbacteria bacterium RIFCSPLOWO2_02_FULL_47_16]OGH80128.1 MAG: hypothetical protein A3C10_03055 [Candidatus Magasanikbacteria bacterium RIFCSPHIGHO2_02_FULL_48_18]OGH82682.1 MAG: hypothetical protein A3G08_01930 [Candidatus Magasanikbacteria bacterium RIFCSPLOWO2_12_FULL_47_9b]HAZ28958.1 hypothetical protein [Candidatus Magasanikbacteria bacterium]
MKVSWYRFGVALPLFLLLGAGCLLSTKEAPQTTGPAGMFLSLDKGESWQQIAALPTISGVESIGNVSVFRLVEDPQDTKTVYLLSKQSGMFYTYDDGKTWQRPSDARLREGLLYSIAIHPKDKCTMYTTNGTEILKTNDCGRSWEDMYLETRSDARMSAIAFEPFHPYDIIVGESNGDILRSTDAGRSWTVTERLKIPVVDIQADEFESGLFYLITKNQGLYRSVDRGYSWDSLQAPLAEFAGALDYRRFLRHPEKPDVLFWISTYGILFSNDRGDSWSAMDLITPPGSVNIYAFDINGHNDNEMYYTATLKDNTRSTFYKTIDGGRTWTTKKLPSGQIPAVLRVHPENESWLYLGYTTP